MSNSVDQCFARIMEAFKDGGFDRAEIRAILDDLSEIRKTSTIDDFLVKATEYRDRELLRQQVLLNKKTATVNKSVQNKRLLVDGLVKDTKKFKNDHVAVREVQDQVRQRAQSFFTGAAKASDEGNLAIGTVQASYYNRMAASVEQVVQELGAHEYVKDPNFSKEIRMELYGESSGNPAAKEIGGAMRKAYNFQVEELRRLGLDMGEIQNYAGWQFYDKQKVLALGKEKFIELTLQNIDEGKTFDGPVSFESKVKRLADAYDHITTGEYVDPSKGRSLHYKGGKEADAVMQAIGAYPNAYQSFLAQANYTSKRMGLIHRFGPLPEEGFKKMNDWVNKVAPTPEAAKFNPYHEDGSLKPLAQRAQERFDYLKTNVENFGRVMSDKALPLETLFNDAKGLGAFNQDAMTEFGNAWRGVKSLQLLGGATLSAVFPDIANGAALVRSFDGSKNLLSEIGKLTQDYFKAIPDRATRQSEAYKFGLYFDDIIGGVAHTLNEDSSYRHGAIAAANRAMFKYTGMTDHDQIIKVATAKLLGTTLGDMSGTVFKELPEQTQRNMLRYGIKEGEWEVMRKATVDLGDGRIAVSPQAILDMDDSLIPKGMHKNDLYTKLNAAFIEVGNLSQLKADAYTSTLLYRGQPADTAMGQALRFMGQFKAAPIQGMRITSRLAKDGSWPLVQAMTMLTMAGYASYATKQIFANKEPKVPTTDMSKEGLLHNAGLLKDAFVRGGGGGILADYAFAEYNKSYRNLAEDMAGPVMGDIAKVAKLTAGIARGEWKENKQEALQFAIRQVPGNNIFWIRGALEATVIQGMQEWLSPGYTLKMDNRLRQQGQGRIVETY